MDIIKRTFTKKNALAIFIVVAIIATLVRAFVFEGFFVNGDSMYPTVTNGSYVFVNKLAYVNSEPQRGDIIVAVPRVLPNRVLKRVIGLPGERFEIVDNKILIKDSREDAGVTLDEGYLASSNTPAIGKTKTNLDPEEYFVMGDNREVSIDSRELGLIDKWDIKGRVIGVFDFETFEYKGF